MIVEEKQSKQCPFCGAELIIGPHDNSTDYTILVHNHKDGCPIKVIVQRSGSSLCFLKTEAEEFFKQWDMRV
jgi:hypothetical protein